MLESASSARGSPSEAEALRSEIAADVFPLIRWLFTAGGVPLLVGVVWVEVLRGKADGMLGLQVLVFVSFLAAAWAPSSQRARAWALSLGLLSSALLAMARYGPLAGNATLLVSAAFAASAVLGLRAGTLIASLSLAGFGAIALGIVHGWVGPPISSDPSDGLVWLRIGLSFGVPLLVLVTVFNRLISAVSRLTGRNRESLRQAHAAEASFRELIEASPELIAIHREGATLYLNPALRRLLGLIESSGSPSASAWSLPGELVGLEARAPGAGAVPPRQLRLRRGDGREVEAEFLCLDVEYQGRPAQVVIGRDVTERNVMLGRLALSDRLASLGTLAAGVAHELNNPLAYVRSNLAYIAGELGGEKGPGDAPPATPEELLAAAEEARQGAERMRIIVRDLGALTRADGAAKGSVDARQAAGWAIGLATPLVGERARLEQDVADGLEIDGNEAHLRQVLLNLIVSAGRSIPPGAPDRNLVRVSGHREGQVVMLAVSDTGPGMPPEVRKRALDPFFSTQPEGEGTGLGLWVCHNLVTAMGGTLTVESEPGRGTTFTISARAAVEAR